MDDDPQLAHLLEEIGVEALSVAGDEDAKILIYAEVHKDFENILFRYCRKGDAQVRSSADVLAISDLLRQAWDHSSTRGPTFTWNGMIYTIEDRKMHVDFLYGDEVDFNDPLMIAKEEELLARHFPGLELAPFEESGSADF